MSAAEAATHWVMVNFDPSNPVAVAKDESTPDRTGRRTRSQEPRHHHSSPVPSTAGPMQISLAGYDMSATQWVLLRYDTTVTGRNEDYRTSVTIDVGLGYGPVDSGSY